MSSSKKPKTGTSPSDGNVPGAIVIVNKLSKTKKSSSAVAVAVSSLSRSPRPLTSAGAGSGNRVPITSTSTTTTDSKTSEVVNASASGSGTRIGTGNWSDPSMNYFKGQRIRRRGVTYRGAAGFRGGPLHVHNRQKWLSIDDVYGGGFQGPAGVNDNNLQHPYGLPFHKPPQFPMGGQGHYPRKSVHDRLGGYAHDRGSGNPFIRPLMGHRFGVRHSLPRQEDIDDNESHVINKPKVTNSSYPPSFNRGSSSSDNPFLNTYNYNPGQQRKRNEGGLLPTPSIPMLSMRSAAAAIVPSDERQWWTASDETFLANKTIKTEPVDAESGEEASEDEDEEASVAEVVKVTKTKANKVGSILANKTEEVTGKRVIGVFGWFVSTQSDLNPYIPVLPRLNPPQSTTMNKVELNSMPK